MGIVGDLSVCSLLLCMMIAHHRTTSAVESVTAWAAGVFLEHAYLKGLVSSIVKDWQNQNFIQSTAEFSVIEYRMFIDKIVGGSLQRTFKKNLMQ